MTEIDEGKGSGGPLNETSDKRLPPAHPDSIEEEDLSEASFSGARPDETIVDVEEQSATPSLALVGARPPEVTDITRSRAEKKIREYSAKTVLGLTGTAFTSIVIGAGAGFIAAQDNIGIFCTALALTAATILYYRNVFRSAEERARQQSVFDPKNNVERRIEGLVSKAARDLDVPAPRIHMVHTLVSWPAEKAANLRTGYDNVRRLEVDAVSAAHLGDEELKAVLSSEMRKLKHVLPSLQRYLTPVLVSTMWQVSGGLIADHIAHPEAGMTPDKWWFRLVLVGIACPLAAISVGASSFRKAARSLETRNAIEEILDKGSPQVLLGAMEKLASLVRSNEETWSQAEARILRGIFSEDTPGGIMTQVKGLVLRNRVKMERLGE